MIFYLIITITNSSNIIGALAALFFHKSFCTVVIGQCNRTIGFVFVFVGVFDFSEIEIVMING